MGRTSKKDIVLTAMRIVLQEYIEVRHVNNVDTCSLCMIFRDEMYHACSGCPMNHFDTTSYVPCMSRECVPVSCNGISAEDLKLQRVIKFYETAIAKIESMSTAKINKTNYKFLIKIDNKIAKTFKLKYCNDCINDYDDPQMCKLCKDGSHQTLEQ